jgi:pyridinium-3,5-biscarboxylic acid mononucleotide sulfurtransferase
MMATTIILPHDVGAAHRDIRASDMAAALLITDNVSPVPASLIDEKIDALQAELRRLGRVVVAFSGGADSAFLAAVARQVLGDDAHAVTAVSPSLAGDEEADCRTLADEWDLRWTPVVTHEMERAAYRINDTDRCYHCKAELMDVVGPIAAEAGATVVLGVNLDDLGDHRPGQLAADQRGAVFPLVTAGFTKADVRAASLALGLRTWDKPAAACLASRVPYGTEVTVALLTQVDRAEAALKRLGFTELRVRHYGDTARIEVPLDRLPDVLACRADVVAAAKAAGYAYVTLDLEGFRSGNLNVTHLGSTS